MKKRGILGLTITIILLIACLVVGYLYKNKENKTDNFDGKLYGFTKKIELDCDEVNEIINDYLIVTKDEKIGIVDINNEIKVPFKFDYFYTISDDLKYFVLEEENNSHLYNNELTEIYSSQNDINVIKDYNTQDFYITENIDSNKFKVYNKNKELVYSGKGNMYDINVIANNKIFLSNKIYDLETKKATSLTEMRQLGDYIYYENKEIYLYDIKKNTTTKYDEVIVNDLGIYRFTKDGKSLYLDYDGKIVQESEKDIEKLGQGFALDYSLCEEGFKVLKDEKPVFDDCFYYIDSELIEQGVITAGKENLNKALFKNGTIKEFTGEIYTTKKYIYERKYIDLPYIDTLYTLDGTKVENKKCMNHFEAINDNNSVCSPDGENYFIVDQDFKPKTDNYSSVYCIDGTDICSIKDKKGLYGIYYKNKVFVEPAYLGFNTITKNEVTYLVLEKINGVDILVYEEGTRFLQPNELILQEDDSYKQLNTNDIILKYSLEEIEPSIRENEKFFLEYAYQVINNDKLGKYKKQVFDLFKIVTDNSEYLNKGKLLRNLKNLEIEKVNSLSVENAAGTYITNKIEMIDDSRRVIYHELIHFLDDNFNDPQELKLYECDDKYYNYAEAIKLDDEVKKECMRIYEGYSSTFITEAGAEVFMSDYFNNKKPTVYLDIVNIFNALSYIYGKDMMTYTFFASDGDATFYKTLTNKALTKKQYDNFIEYLDKITNIDYVVTDKDLIKISDYLVKIYKAENTADISKDLEFKYILSLILDWVDIVSYKEVTKNYSLYKTLTPTYKISNIIEKKLGPKYGIISNYSSINNDGELVLIFSASKHEADSSYEVGHLIVDYDFVDKKINNYEFILNSD